MGRTIYRGDETPDRDLRFELSVSTKGKPTYLYRFLGLDLVTVHKYGEESPLPSDEVFLLQSLAYSLRRLHDPVVALCNCPWMTHHPDDRCKHSRLVVAGWAHDHDLWQLYEIHGKAPLDIKALSEWDPTMPKLTFGETPVA